ncbi:RNA polymerase sigma factor [Nocardia sp. NPDC127579]|uniref:RNA polymerase sigma factor n=1 Tax=Nocardia sp. NPDC127579 TaxID=3345402 RepID=UPI003642FB7D
MEVAAFSDFYRKNVPRLVAFLVEQHGATEADAADVAQDTMTKLWRSWSSIDYPWTWVCTVSSRAYARRFGRLAEDPVAEISERTALWSGHLDFAAAECQLDFLSALAALPPRQRQVMAWTFAQFTTEQIASTLQITRAAVRANLMKARRTIATNWEAGEDR